MKGKETSKYREKDILKGKNQRKKSNYKEKGE